MTVKMNLRVRFGVWEFDVTCGLCPLVDFGILLVLTLQGLLLVLSYCPHAFIIELLKIKNANIVLFRIGFEVFM